MVTTSRAQDAELRTGVVLPRPFGPFMLLHRLARGGMGQVYLARAAGVAGIDKTVVVKTVAPEQASDPAERARFLEEARVSVQLSHKNICPITGAGEVQGVVYLAMDYVQGRDLRRVQERLAERGARLPAAVAVHVACEVLEALGYAHRLADRESGAPLHIVHRDVSPANVLVSYEGEVKLIDFGLAGPALATVEPGAGGGVLGKLLYMSPEQAFGQPVDLQTDVFSAGVLAYELVTGRRYYAGLSNDEVWRALRDGYLPPGFLELDDGLQSVLAPALSRDRHGRYASAEDMRAALDGYLSAMGLRASAADVRALMGELFPEGPAQDRELLARFRGVGGSGPVGRAPVPPGAQAASGSAKRPPGVVLDAEATVPTVPGLGAPPAARRPGADLDDPTELVRVRGGDVTRREHAPASMSSEDAPSSASPAPRRAVAARAALWGLGAAALATASALVVAALLGRFDEAPAPIAAAPPAAATPAPPQPVAAPAPAPAAAIAAGATPTGAAADEAAGEGTDQGTAADEGADAASAGGAPDEAPAAASDDDAPPARAAAKADGKDEKRARAQAGPRPRPKARTLSENLKLLERCQAKVACAKDLARRKSELATMPLDQTRAFSGELDRCIAACLR